VTAKGRGCAVTLACFNVAAMGLLASDFAPRPLFECRTRTLVSIRLDWIPIVRCNNSGWNFVLWSAALPCRYCGSDVVHVCHLAAIRRLFDHVGRRNVNGSYPPHSRPYPARRTSSLSILRPSRSTTSNTQPCSVMLSPSSGKWRKAARTKPAAVA